MRRPDSCCTLRPSGVAAAASGSPPTDEVEAALRQFVSWGNLSADPDTADVSTVEEFYRARFLYRLTPAGEAAERALAVFEEGIRRPGELQTAALADIRDLLHELADHAGRGEGAPVDAGKVRQSNREVLPVASSDQVPCRKERRPRGRRTRAGPLKTGADERVHGGSEFPFVGMAGYYGGEIPASRRPDG